MSDDRLLLSQELYKQTVAFDYVVKRHVKLYSNRFETYAKLSEPEDHRIIWLDDTAVLQPDRKDAIQLKKRYLRPPGVGSMTALAAVRGKGKQLSLYTFKLKRDEHSSFTFAFDDKEQAFRWFDTLSQAISELRVKAGKGPYPPAAALYSTQTSLVEGPATLPPTPFTTLGRTGVPSDGPVLLQVEDSVALPPMTLCSSHHALDQEEQEYLELLNLPAGETTRAQQRWVPYRQSNGLAIYRHHSNGAPPEYMVSAVIRGSPAEVLRVLMDPHAPTSILGPALEVEVLDSSTGKQTLRILLQAEGPNAAWFRPREAVVRRVLRKEEDGVYVVLFSSTDNALTRMRHEGVIEVAEGVDEGVCRTNPIRCRVFGGYTISKLSGARGSSSAETLLTCILQVEDMGGWLNPGHPLFRVVNWWSGGAYEAFLERMLLGVMLVRDVVEKSRFAVSTAGSLMPELFQRRQSEYGARQAPVPRSSSVVIRSVADRVSSSSRPHPLSPTTTAAASSSPFEQGASKPLHAQLHAVQQQQLVKVSRLASQRLGSGAATRTRTQSLGKLLTDSMRAAVQEGTAQQQQQEWVDPPFMLPHKFYEEIHTPGTDAPFKVRGPNYLSDGVKVAPGQPLFELLGMEVVNTGSSEPLTHISRFLPSIRRSSKPFLFVWNMIVPGPPTICCVFVFGADSHPDALGPPPDDPEDSDWQPFDFLMWRFLHGDDDERSSLFKMIPRIAEGSWVVRQSVGTTPVIVGRKLTTNYFITPKYVEVAVDVGSSSTAQYVTGMVRGGCKNLVLDLGVVLEGQHTWELPEVLLGAVRVKRLDLAAASKIDLTKEVPLLEVQPAAADSASSVVAA